ncbi:MAG: glycosyltransferase family 2 protein [Nitrospinae bacterium]|nr:glycosyltransferase family 2 protein [Nitrospinota bacterium]
MRLLYLISRFFIGLFQLDFKVTFVKALRKIALYLLPFYYERHKYSVQRVVTRNEKRLKTLGEKSRKSIEGETVSVFIVIHCRGGQYLQQTLDSINQSNSKPVSIFLLNYRKNHELKSDIPLFHDATNSKKGILLFMSEGDILHHEATSLIYSYVTRFSYTIVYSDTDFLDSTGKRLYPQYFPDWSPELFYSRPYFLNFFALNATDFTINLDKLTQSFYAELLRVVFAVMKTNYKIGHISEILFSRLEETPEYFDSHNAIKEVLSEHVSLPVDDGLIYKSYRVRYKVQDNTMVSIIIPTRDKVDFLRTCVDSVLRFTQTVSFEIIVVDNNSEEKDTFTYFEEIKKRDNVDVLSYPGDFNYSAINNFAVQKAQGNVLLFLNNDVEVLNEEWIHALLEHATRKEIGAVGGLLLYPNQTVQHAGVVMGLNGLVDHIQRHENSHDEGYCAYLKLIRNFSAVTGACMMVEKSKFNRVNGFNEDTLHVEYNDVDLCLKLLQVGYRNVYTPFCKLIHHEFVSRKKAFESTNETEYLRSTWKALIEHDPMFNKNLTLYSNCYDLNFFLNEDVGIK